MRRLNFFEVSLITQSAIMHSFNVSFG